MEQEARSTGQGDDNAYIQTALKALAADRISTLLLQLLCCYTCAQIRAAQMLCHLAQRSRARGPAAGRSAGTARRGRRRGCTSVCTPPSCACPTAAPVQRDRVLVGYLLTDCHVRRHVSGNCPHEHLCCTAWAVTRQRRQLSGSKAKLLRLTVAFQTSSTGHPAASTAGAASVL